MQHLLGRVTAVTVACVLASGLATGPVTADTGVGSDAYLAVGGHELDAGFVQVLQSALDSQFVGLEVAIVRGRLVISGYATPGVHTAVLAIVGNLLQNPVPIPIGLDVISSNLGLGALPFLGAGLGVEIPDLSGILDALGVVDRIRVVR